MKTQVTKQSTQSPSAGALLEVTSITYLRRLAKELNALPDGFYYEGVRYNRASAYSLGDYGLRPFGFRISRPSDDGDPDHSESRGMSGDCLGVFTDAYGRAVYASRAAAKQSNKTR